MSVDHPPKTKQSKATTWRRWKTPQKLRPWFIGGLLAWLIFGVFVWGWNTRNQTHFPKGHEEVYHFTTSFEAFHALVDGLALICLLFTIWQQRDELRHLQDAVGLQAFQNNFFNYLSLFNQFVSSLSEGNREGRECITEWRRILDSELESSPEAEQECWDAMSKPRKNHLLPYFQHLMNVLEIVAKECPEADSDNYKKNPFLELKQYVQMVNAQLSPDERSLLERYCKIPTGWRARELVERLGLLANEQPLKEEHPRADPKASRSA